MADHTKFRSKQQADTATTDFDAHELKATMHEFLKEEEKSNTNVWNFSTIAGIAMFFVAIVYIIQSVGLAIGPDLSGLIEVLPLIGGVIITVIGFGYIVKDKKKSKNKKKSSSKYNFDYDFDSDTETKQESEDFTLNNDLGEKKQQEQKSSSAREKFDRYAFQRSKKLYKSRTDKKISGVCGGLAKYFGISAGVIRALFIITLFAAGGTSLLIYIALAIALDKEPPEMMEDFDY